MAGTMLTIQRKGNTQIAPTGARDGRRLGDPQRRRRVLVADGREPQGRLASGSRTTSAIVLAPRTEFLPAARRPRVVRRAPDDPRGALPAAAEDRAPRPPADQAVVDPPDRRLGEAARHRTPSSLVGKPALRVHADAQGGGGSSTWCWRSTFPIGILHFPAPLLRAVPQEDRARRRQPDVGSQRTSPAPFSEAYESGRLEDVYENLILDEETVGQGLAEGWLVEDTAFRDYLARVPRGPRGRRDAASGVRALAEERRADGAGGPRARTACT